MDVSISKWASPAVDLAYFFYSSTTPNLRETHMEDMLGHYHDTFIRCLGELGMDPTVYPYRQVRNRTSSLVPLKEESILFASGHS